MRSAIKYMFFGIIVLFSVSALGANKPVEKKVVKPSDVPVAVITLPSNDVKTDEQARIQDALLDQALAHSGPDLDWQLVAFSPPRYSPPEQGIQADLKKSLETGKQEYRYLKLPEALSTFKNLFQRLRTDPPAKCDPATVAELFLYWARATLDNGDETLAQKLLGEILRFDPKASPDPAVMAPNVVASFDSASEYRKHKPQTEMSLEVGPGQGSLFVDCNAKPAGSVEITGVVGDELWLAAEIERGTFRAPFTFREGPKRRLKVWSGYPKDLSMISEHFGIISRTPPTLGELSSSNVNLDAIASILNVQILLLGKAGISPTGKKVDVALYVPGKGVQGAPTEVAIDENGEPKTDSLGNAINQLAENAKNPTLLALLTPLIQPSPRDKGAKHKGSEKATPWYKTWWFWTAVGAVVVVAVVTGAVVGTRNSGSSNKLVIKVNQPQLTIP
jgi:hypothetical protein